MGRTIILLCFIGQNLCYGQEAISIKLTGDTLQIADPLFIDNPFGFGDKPYYQLKYKSNSKPWIEATARPNDHVEHQVDTSYRLKFGKDYFQIYKTGEGIEFLIYADLSTSKFKTRHGIYVGMTKQKLQAILGAYHVDALPRVLVIGDLNYSYLKLEFKGTKIDKIVYDGYLD